MTLLDILFGKHIDASYCLVQRYMFTKKYRVSQRLAMLAMSERLQRAYKTYD